jgi:AcrR family transcriptional regulator
LSHPSPSTARPDADVKTRLLEAASQLLDEAGPTGMSLREVARRAGVSHAAPYNHFANKEALLATLAVEGWRALDRSMHDAQQMASPTALEQLVATGLGYIRFALQRPAAYKLMLQREFAAPSLAAELFDCAISPYRRMLTAVRTLREQQGMPTDDPAIDADGLVLWSLVHGMASLSIDSQIEGLPRNDLQVYRQLLMRIEGMYPRAS